MEIIRHPLNAPNVHPLERWASIVGGGALAVSGLRNGKGGILRAATGAVMIHRGLTGRCPGYKLLGVRTAASSATLPYDIGIRVRAAVTIDHPRHQIYQFWREFTNLPRFMRHLRSVEPIDALHSHWVAEGPGNRRFEWDAEIINEIPNELLAWKSLPGSDVDSAGSVRFTEAPGERGTELRVKLQYSPPKGLIGAYIARLMGREPEQEIQSDLARLKQFLESGEVSSTEGQPHGNNSGKNSRYVSTIDEAVA